MKDSENMASGLYYFQVSDKGYVIWKICRYTYTFNHVNCKL